MEDVQTETWENLSDPFYTNRMSLLLLQTGSDKTGKVYIQGYSAYQKKASCQKKHLKLTEIFLGHCML